MKVTILVKFESAQALEVEKYFKNQGSYWLITNYHFEHIKGIALYDFVYITTFHEP